MRYIRDLSAGAAGVMRRREHASAAAASRAGCALILICLCATPLASEPLSVATVCERRLGAIQERFQGETLAAVRAACLERAAASGDAAVERVFDACLVAQRPDLCLSETLADAQRFAALAADGQTVGDAEAGGPAADIAALQAPLAPQALAQQLMGDRLLLEPVTAETLLLELLGGTSLEDASVRGLRPGVAYRQAEDTVRRQWRYSGTGPDHFGPPKPARFAAATRDGGSVHFDVIEERVGQIKYTEHYKVVLDANVAREKLIARFGAPDEEQGSRVGWILSWSGYPTRMQVKVVNQADSEVGYQSTIELALWSREYETLLTARKQRCGSAQQDAAEPGGEAPQQAPADCEP